MVDRPLIIFDSGIGGLSILKLLLTYDTPILYYADQANFPYGNHDPSWIKERFVELAEIFASYSPCALVIACNTATVAAIDTIRERLSCPVFGVEPVVKMLAHHKNPVVWGTSTTISSVKAALLRSSFAPQVRYYTPLGLPTAIEHDDQLAIREILSQSQRVCHGADAIGLSCTHYSLIKDTISSFFPRAKVYDPSEAVANHIANQLHLAPTRYNPERVTYLSSSSVVRLKKLAQKYL